MDAPSIHEAHDSAYAAVVHLAYGQRTDAQARLVAQITQEALTGAEPGVARALSDLAVAITAIDVPGAGEMVVDAEYDLLRAWRAQLVGAPGSRI